MKSLSTLLALMLFAHCWVCMDAFAQWDWSGSVEAGVYQNQNIFRSPDRLLLGGQLVGVDSLYQSDLAIPLELDLSLMRRSKRHTIRVDYSSNLQRYGRYNNLNGGWHVVRLRNRLNAGNTLEINWEVEGRRSKRVATNVLGDQLSRLFQYQQIGTAGSVVWDVASRHSLEFEYEWNVRDYTESGESPSLDSKNHIVSMSWDYRSARRNGTYWKSSVEAEYRAKNYLNYRARDAFGNQSEFYPINHLDYYDLEIGIERTRSRKWSVELGIGLRYRHDPFEDFYTYTSGHIQFDVAWSPVRVLTLELDTDWRRMIHAVKDAPQSGAADNPALRYDFVDWTASVEYRLLNYAFLTVFVESDSRRSNATLESSRVRRSYDSMQGGIALKIDLDRMVSN